MKKGFLDKKKIVLLVLLALAGGFLFFQGTEMRREITNYAMGKGSYYFNGGAYNLTAAKRWYRGALWMNSSLPLAHYQLSRIYFVEGRMEEALQEVNKELAKRPSFGRAYYMRGLIEGFRKNLDAAEADFKKIFEVGLDEYTPSLDAGGWAVYNDLSWVQFQKGEYGEMEKTAREGLRKYPHNPWLLNSLGLGLMNLKKNKEAKATFEDALRRAEMLSAEDVRRAYPGNDPAGWEDKRRAIIRQIRFNQTLVR